MKNLLWWGRCDPDYSRNRVLRQIFQNNNFLVSDYQPNISRLAVLEAALRRLSMADLIWVPCFRQRDLAAAVRWGRRKNIPVVFDPLISAYDKQVFERKKFSVESRKARKLLEWEQRLFAKADLVIADTWEHARYFTDVLQLDSKRIAVVPVGAEEDLFQPALIETPSEAVPPVLFFGSFLNLQGPETIVQAARLYQGPPVVWKLIGEGPLLDSCRQQAAGLSSVEFYPWVRYEELPAEINRADILLGVFGTSEKAGRVIPNKVYQALACGKPLITRAAPAYPESFHGDNNLGICWVDPGSPRQLAERVAELVTDRANLIIRGRQARQTYEAHFSMRSISASLMSALEPLL